MRLDYNSSESLAPVIEAVLFASDEPLPAQMLRSVILGEETPKTDVNEPLVDEQAEESGETPEEGQETLEAKPKRKRKSPIELSVIHAAIEDLNRVYKESGRGFRIVEIAGGYQFATRGEYGEYVARLFKDRSRRRLSGAALETLAIIAYKQPVAKLDIENIRGVNCDDVLKSLLEKNLVTITGRAEAVGRPLLYGTTVDFLRHFGLHGLSDLPKPREIEELLKEESIRATTLEEAASEFVSPQIEEGLTIDSVIAEIKSHGESRIASDATHAFTEERMNRIVREPGVNNDPSGTELDAEGFYPIAHDADSESDELERLVKESLEENAARTEE